MSGVTVIRRNLVVAAIGSACWFLFSVRVVAELFWVPGAFYLIAAVFSALVFLLASGTGLTRFTLAVGSSVPYLSYAYISEILTDPHAPDRPLSEAFLLMIAVGAVVGAAIPPAIKAIAHMKPNHTVDPDARKNGTRGSP